MTNPIEKRKIQCPFCWEKFELLVDCTISNQSYIEDCEVCCKPININITIHGFNDVEIDISSDE